MGDKILFPKTADTANPLLEKILGEVGELLKIIKLISCVFTILIKTTEIFSIPLYIDFSPKYGKVVSEVIS